MARTVLTPTRLSSSGVEPAPVAANVDGYKLLNDGRIWLLVKNTNGASAGANVVVNAELTRDGLSLPDKTVAVAASEERYIGPFDPGVYNRSGVDAGQVHIDFTGAVTDLVIQAFRAP